MTKELQACKVQITKLKEEREVLKSKVVELKVMLDRIDNSQLNKATPVE